jgi:hypothetical protein
MTAAVLTLTLIVSVASAAEPAPKGVAGAFELKGTHGYELTGTIFSTGRAGVLILYAKKNGAVAEYVVRGTVTAEGAADFDLRTLGRIDVTLQRTGRTETVHPNCGRPFTEEVIKYVGTIEFHGEEGFTEVATASMPLTQKPLAEIICPGFSVSEQIGGRGSGLKVRVTETSGPSLTLQRNPGPHARVFYEARIKEVRGNVKVNRLVTGHVPATAVQIDRAYDAATFAAGSPFAGKATYAQTRPPRHSRRDRGTWLGDLTVDFPGHRAVRLAGPGFIASTMHATRHESSPITLK